MVCLQESPMPEVIIVGGGVIGLSLAWELSRRGINVELFDSHEIGRGASWAGAGLVPPPHRAPDLTDPTCLLRARSAHLYPIWSEQLKDETGIDNGFRVSGGLDIALNPREEPALQSMTGRWRKQGIRFELVDDIRAAQLEPLLTKEFTRAYYLPERSQIRNPRHLRALQVAAGHRGVRFYSHSPIREIIIDNSVVKGVTTDFVNHFSDVVVVTAGARSGQFMEKIGVQMPTRPIKGQMLLLEPGQKILNHIIEHEKCYLVPRDEGLVLAGATEELVGFDESLTDDARELLWNEATSLVPALAQAKVIKQWCGFRPGSKDSRPYLGEVCGIKGLYVATGHQRAGLSLSPATAESMADVITGQPPQVNLDGYRIDREPAASRNDTTRS